MSVTTVDTFTNEMGLTLYLRGRTPRIFSLLLLLILVSGAAYAAKICPECGRQYSDDANYCTQCIPPVKLVPEKSAPPVSQPESKSGSKPTKPVSRLIISRIRISGDSVVIASVPSGAKVYWDGVFKGYTPLIITRAAAGYHQVRLVLSGYEESIDTVKISFSIMKVFARSVQQFRSRRYSAAIQGLRMCLDSAPDFQFADSAQWLIAECYYHQQLYDSAVVNYNDLITKYPKSKAVPAALYKIALSYISLNSPGVARNFLKKLLREFPDSPYAEKAAAKLNELKDRIAANITVRGTTVWIITRPANVDVIVDNSYLGKTRENEPMKIRLEPGMHRITFVPPRELSDDYRMTQDSILIPIPKDIGPSPILCGFAGGILNAVVPGLGSLAFDSSLNFFTLTTYLAGTTYLLDTKMRGQKNFFTAENARAYNQLMKYELYLTAGAYVCNIVSGFVSGYNWARRKRE